ncbi:NADH-quinone oxidoreductase subunit A [Sphingobacterium sp. SGG-5]|uniref:NADH-quinone oxidoreductase subunit A n=1 Tax=Sphingobacterium sp. SGG-5 TaxID=2710881 RepID=UPI0013EACA9D|nr:NADH-quinone oxidoreductase subunit A [Sphingobacterium sp. SGG-5]NGM60307.1 NADH-quinone oxidoreductase subunit A [Sphingobacterium sp. SGG-5]
MDDHPTQLSAYGYILLIGIVGILLVSVTILLSKLVSPRKPNPIKLSTYECGEETVGSSWTQFNPRFYIIALIFLLFDVELIFVFPWATVFGNREFIAADPRWGWLTLVEMAIFIGILILGLVYVWKRGLLNWVKTTHVVPQVDVSIPASVYDALNKRSYAIRDYRAIADAPDNNPVPSAEPAAKPKLGFRPKFKKPGT